MRRLFPVFAAILLANVGFGTAWPYLPIAMRILGGGFLSVALIMASFNAVMSVVQYPMGRLSDRLGSRRTFAMVGQLGTSALMASMFLAGSVPAFLAARAAMGLFQGVSVPSINALIAAGSRGWSGRGFGTANFFGNLGFFLGNLLGSRVSRLDPKLPLAVGSLFILSSALPLLAVREEGREHVLTLFRGEKPLRIPATRPELRPELLPAMAASTLIFTSSGMVYAFLSLYFEKLFGTEHVGLIFSSGAAATIVSVYAFGRLQDIHGKEPYLVLGALLYVAVYLLYGRVHGLGAMLLVEALSGTKYAIVWNGFQSLAADLSPRGREASTMGLISATASLGWTLGPILGALVLRNWDFHALFLAATSLAAASLLPLGWTIKVKGGVSY